MLKPSFRYLPLQGEFANIYKYVLYISIRNTLDGKPSRLDMFDLSFSEEV